MKSTTELENKLNELISSQQTLMMATANLDALPEVSVTPFVQNSAGCFYILVSDLAGHTANLQKNPKISVLVVRPEAECTNPFARERAIFNCQVREVSKSDPIYAAQIQALTNKFGETVRLLNSLPDFHLFELRPESGRYVLGFGQAYQIDVLNQRLIPIERK